MNVNGCSKQRSKIIQIITIFMAYIQEMGSILIKTMNRAGGAIVYVTAGIGVLVMPALGIVGFVVEPWPGSAGRFSREWSLMGA